MITSSVQGGDTHLHSVFLWPSNLNFSSEGAHPHGGSDGSTGCMHRWVAADPRCHTGTKGFAQMTAVEPFAPRAYSSSEENLPQCTLVVIIQLVLF